jgi:hypothetical protein
MIAVPVTPRRTRPIGWAVVSGAAITGGLASVGAPSFLPVWVVVMAASQGLVSLASP